MKLGEKEPVEYTCLAIMTTSKRSSEMSSSQIYLPRLPTAAIAMVWRDLGIPFSEQRNNNCDFDLETQRIAGPRPRY